ncbi:Bug family tripartite tricarboxylate transporter substrate binding protein [Ramlibacter sp.]|uniref:Bug family tripartite tricarboxylate transporter substrate binding protein n=1 Tax=Ramlibacter sp. TaxID=1917967 RepID=UPI003D127848
MPSITRRAALGATLAPFIGNAWAAWPERPIRTVVPYTAGGGADKVGRAIESGMQAALGQPLVFEYRPGGSGTVGALAVANAPADGYSILVADNGPVTIIPSAKSVGYDPTKNLTPIGVIGEGAYAIAINAAFPARTLADLVRLSKAKPKSIAYASPAVGGPGHLFMELFAGASGADLIHVPYKGGAQVMTDLVGGHVPIAMVSPGTAVPHVQSGKVRVLGITTTKRSSVFPDVPTIAEQGYPGFDASVWIALFGPGNLPADVTDRLRKGLETALARPESQRQLRDFGYEPGTTSTVPLAARVRAEVEKWGTLMKARGIVLE